MTITKLGQNYRRKYGQSSKSDFQLGIQLLQKEPVYWEHIDSHIVGQVIARVEAESFKLSGFPAKWRKWKAEKTAQYYEALAGALMAYVHLGEVELMAMDIHRRHVRAPRDLANADAIQDALNAHDRIQTETRAIQAEMARTLLPETFAVQKKEIQVKSSTLDNQMAVLHAASDFHLTPELYLQKMAIQIEAEKKKELDAAELFGIKQKHEEDRHHLVAANQIVEEHNERNRRRGRTDDSSREET